MNNWWYWHKPRISKKAIPYIIGMVMGIATGILWILGVFK